MCLHYKEMLEQLSSWYLLLCSLCLTDSTEFLPAKCAPMLLQVMLPEDLTQSPCRVPICFISFEWIQRCRETPIRSTRARY